MFKKWILLTTLAVGLAAGCGSDDEPRDSNGGIVGSNNGSNGVPDGGHRDVEDATPEDAGDVEDGGGKDVEDGGRDTDVSEDGGDATDPDGEDVGECPEVPCGEGEDCIDGRCTESSPQRKCEEALDLGTLSASNPIVVTDTTSGATDILETTCSSGGSELVYRFTVAEDSMVSFESNWPDQFDAKVEFRLDDCEEFSGGSACFDSNDSFPALAGSNIYLMIEQDVGRGNDFELELTATPESCPPGVEFCGEGARQVCLGSGQSNSYDCAADCADTDYCAGSQCQNAIPVTGSMTFEGSLGAYQNAMDFQTNAFCEYEGNSVPTPGPEVIFRLDGLSEGQTVSITTGGNRAMFITASCAAPIVCTDVYLSTGSGGTVDWEVPQGANDETFYVIIDRRTGTLEDFSYSFAISN